MASSVIDIKDCYGCGLCSVVCKYGVIDMKIDENGFFQPYIKDLSACTNCGLCSRICSYTNELEDSIPISCYAAWSNDNQVLHTSTSGGVGYEVAKHLLSQGYTFCGVRYNAELSRAEHYLALDQDSLEMSKGSKYLQSFTKDAFSNINIRNKNLVVGTPCQIASFRRYIELFNCSENFILMDFFCHGVPSYLMWKKYLKEHGGRSVVGIKNVSWRNKQKGWRNSYCITLQGPQNAYVSWNGNDDFFSMYLGDACLGKACYDSCKFKYGSSAADLRIGDFWGKTYEANSTGVSSVLVFSQKADDILHQSNLTLKGHPLQIVASGQMRENVKRPWYHKQCMKNLKDEKKLLSTIALMVRLSKKIKGHFNRLRKNVNR